MKKTFVTMCIVFTVEIQQAYSIGPLHTLCEEEEQQYNVSQNSGTVFHNASLRTSHKRCNLSLIHIELGVLSLSGVRKQTACIDLRINREYYCVDPDAVGALVNVTGGNLVIELEKRPKESFTIYYMKGW